MKLIQTYNNFQQSKIEKYEFHSYFLQIIILTNGLTSEGQFEIITDRIKDIGGMYRNKVCEVRNTKFFIGKPKYQKCFY